MINGTAPALTTEDAEKDPCDDAVIEQLGTDLEVLVEEFGPERVARSLVMMAMAVQDLEPQEATAWLRNFAAGDVN